MAFKLASFYGVPELFIRSVTMRSYSDAKAPPAGQLLYWRDGWRHLAC